MAERPEDLNLPNSVIARIIKEALPDGVIVSKDAKLAISKAASVFVLYATSCANNFAMNHKRKTIAPQDVIESMKEMEFEKFVDVLKESLSAYKEEQKSRKESNQKKKGTKETGEDKEAKKTESSGADNTAEDGEAAEAEEEVVISDDEEEEEKEEDKEEDKEEEKEENAEEGGSGQEEGGGDE